MSTATTPAREAFENAVALARRVLFEGVPVADIAAQRGVNDWQVAARVVQPLTDAIFDFAKAANASAEITAAIDALKTYDDPDGDDD